jgi:2-oxoglutarate dehydrogenase complex dehydrogenase (E1) component-like enzyme
MRKLAPGAPFHSSTRSGSSYADPITLPYLQLSYVFFQTEEVLDRTKIAAIRTAHKSGLETALSRVSAYVPSASMLEKQWAGMVWPTSATAERNPATGVEQELLKDVGRASVNIPEGFVSAGSE